MHHGGDKTAADYLTDIEDATAYLDDTTGPIAVGSALGTTAPSGSPNEFAPYRHVLRGPL
ncbi:hypothetical protein LK09_17665 [Microbacterium mangrovi]|uniref:Uncharacterized protein n=1 Tax=Microbacterium mangrovi TaxID=1348253 RepID=A0A0B1ZYP0_9MICO|nr:hypothetical protein [Microbacterium mangrovi]KHK95856.1 hypothetical protein LK09_17665 [Microbacterium mangrovi]